MSIRQAVKNYNIPFSTLRERIQTGVISDPKIGGKTVFTPAQEKAMAEEIKTLANLFYGLTPLQIRSGAYYFAQRNNIPNKFNRQTKLAGKDWLCNFLKRTNMAVRKPEQTSINRVISFNESDVNIFFDNLELLFEKYNFPASKIWNMDETGISNVQQPENIVAEKGQRRVASIVTAERGKNVTLICAMSAAGNFVPPMFIFPRQRMKDTLSKNGPIGAIYKCSLNGWSNTELFMLWLYHFKDYVKCTKNNPILLILDNHNSHISLNSYNYCKENGIVMLSLVPHTSHRLQPLDVCFFGPFKTAYRKECDEFLKKEALKKISHDDLAEIVNKAYCKVASIEKGVSGFKTTGIYPLNRRVFQNKTLWLLMLYYKLKQHRNMRLIQQ
nr:PREDICTED: uncharacterized protein LOC105679296 [Linepithema humile]